MHINELDRYKLSDAVKFNARLNPKIWGKDEHMKPEVHSALMKIAEDFKEFLGVNDLNLKDITVSGSNAAFTYTPHSDIDLHLVVDLPEADSSEVYRELFDAKKYAYNNQHNIKIGDYDVELYVQNANKPPVSQGEYSLLNNEWLQVPRRQKSVVDDRSTRSKYQDMKQRIDDAIKTGDYDTMAVLQHKIRQLRQSGLDEHGEFGPENLAFKMLRTQGYIGKLIAARNAAKDKELSLKETDNPIPIRYGFKTQEVEAVAEAPAEPEKPTVSVTDIINEFFDRLVDELNIKSRPVLKIRRDPQWSRVNTSFGRYTPDTNTLEIATSNRHVLDILRTMAHELTHCAQAERETLPDNAGETGSPWEDEANYMAGRIMRDIAAEHPEFFADVQLTEGWINKAAVAAAMAAAMAASPAPAHAGNQGQYAADLIQSAAIVYGLKNLTSAGAKEEFKQEAKNLIQAAGGDTGAQNVSHLYNLKGSGTQQQAQPDYQQPRYASPPSSTEYRAPGYKPRTNESSGYIPTKAQAKDPRFKTALTVDIHPGQTGKEANKLKLNTDAQGNPDLLIKNLANQLREFKETDIAKPKSYGYNSTPLSQVPGETEDELGNQEATGPEFPPQMPAGTTKIDVTDLTDWYRLGMDISDLDDADPKDYNQGPPQTVVVFPSDEAEQGYLKQFKRLGLKTHDMDPDVEGGEDLTGKHMKELSEEFELLEEEFLGEIKMTGKNLAQLAKDINGVKVGLEFEMIVPNVENEDDELSQDYDMDERVNDIDDACTFFDDGGYNSSREISSLRQNMQEDYWNWRSEHLDEDWFGGDGYDFFVDYMEREAPFDEDEAREEATNALHSEYGDDITPEDFDKMLNAMVQEKRQEYYQEQWDDQGREYDYAKEEYEQDKGDDYTESEWLRDQGIRYMSDIESNYDITWPYYTSSNDGESDIKTVALDFMNGIGMDSVAVSPSYHGSYEKWVGDEWVNIGSNKPEDCFTVEPDGSLDGDNSTDAGLEFVSYPIPLEDVGTVMEKVQNWAGNYGAYTGKRNKTSMHTNISIPGYSLENLDYLKAALLLGDEHVLREFDRISNTYTAPAIEKVRQLVKQNPDKAKELLDKMKSQLNAAASKLIHTGSTNKFTSINTKDNRIEFRSPGGDYLDDIANDPKKLQDTINRMVVTMDAALDPNKYKQEYQKKLYKLLTGQQFGREGTTGAKKEMKASDKDLLNIFSRYAAGELPKAALKSFVRQAQLERKGKKAEADLASHNWAIRRGFGGDIVRTFRADDYVAAYEYLQQYKQKHNVTDDSLTYGPYDPSQENPAQQPSTQFGAARGAPNYAVVRSSDGAVVHRFHAADRSEALGLEHDFVRMQGWNQSDYRLQDEPQTSAPISGSTLDLQRQRAAQQGVDTNRDYELYNRTTGEVIDTFQARNDDEAMVRLDDYREHGQHGQARHIATQMFGVRRGPGVDRTAQPTQPHPQGNWGIWITSNERFARVPYTFEFRRFPSRQEAEQFLTVTREANPRMRNDVEVREIEPSGQAAPQPTDQQQGGIVDVAGEQPATAPQTLTRPGHSQQQFTGEWKIVDPNGNEIYRFGGIGNAQSDANRVAMDWLQRNPRQMVAGVEVLPVMG